MRNAFPIYEPKHVSNWPYAFLCKCYTDVRGLKGEKYKNQKTEKQVGIFFMSCLLIFTKVNSFPRGEQHPLPIIGNWSSFDSTQHLASENTDTHHFKEILITVYIFSLFFPKSFYVLNTVTCLEFFSLCIYLYWTSVTSSVCMSKTPNLVCSKLEAQFHRQHLEDTSLYLSLFEKVWWPANQLISRDSGNSQRHY